VLNLDTVLGVVIFLLAGLLTSGTLWQALLPAGALPCVAFDRRRDRNADASGQTIHSQARPRRHLARILVLDVEYSGRDPLCARAGDYQDHMRPCSAVGCIWPLS
jgi:hypothetical protein